MKKIIISFLVLFGTINAKAIKVKFTVANMSVNVAEGTTGIFTSFQVYPNNFKQEDLTDLIELEDFESINYNDIARVIIEKTTLGENVPQRFKEIPCSFTLIEGAISGNVEDFEIVQGRAYAYRLKIITKEGKGISLMNKSTITHILDPSLNCVKLNNLYRKSCHNCFQESIISPGDGGFYRALDFTRVVELDIHGDAPDGAYEWEVRHNPYLGDNSNNCGHGTVGDKPLGICLEDMIKWHNDNPNHDVITLYIDIKSRWNNNNGHGPSHLDQLLLDFVPNVNDIYRPRDILGNANSSNFNNMRLAARDNNWPSLGDLTGNFIFVLTGDDEKLSQYVNDRGRDAVAFVAENLKHYNEDSGIWPTVENSIVFLNAKFSNTFDQGVLLGSASSNNNISRVWKSGFVGQPGGFSNSNYADAVLQAANNIAVADIISTYNTTTIGSENGVQEPTRAINPLLDEDLIYSTYGNVTQAATQTITATNLIVEAGTHYRMIAGKEIDLQPGVEFVAGSEVDVRIDDCTGADYNLRPAGGEQLTQEEIDAIMHELDKELYSYKPSDESEVVNLSVYPNPTADVINISYSNYLLVPITFALRDLTGRTVLTKKYQTQQIGRQNFSISLSNLKEGTYFYSLRVGEQTYNGKVVKMEF